MSFIFLLRRTAFDFLLPADGSVGINEAVVVDELRQVVATGETRDQFVPVLPDAIRKIADNACVQHGRLRTIGHDVDKELPRGAHCSSLADPG